jgi:hypothetical protein
MAAAKRNVSASNAKGTASGVPRRATARGTHPGTCCGATVSAENRAAANGMAA